MDVDLHSPELKRLLSDWLSWRHGRTFPARRDFEPAEIRYILGRVNLLDVLYEPLRFRWRLHGSDVVRYVGRDMTGRFAHEDSNVEFRGRVYAEYGHAVEQRIPVTFSHVGVLDGRSFNYELLVLPLAADGEMIDMLLAGFDFGRR